jgi:hypothetical protein
MKTYGTWIIIGLCVLGMPIVSEGALDWRIEWDEANSPHTARVFLFNPEPTMQSFMLEIGDIARTSDDDPYAPYLIVGQDVSLRNIPPSKREIFDIVVYRDIDTASLFSAPPATMASQLAYDQHQQQVRILGERYGAIESRHYPLVNILGIAPVPREESTQNRVVYRSSRGYWITALIDHDHIAEQIIRTGNRMGARYASIQQALYYYTQGNVQLTGQAADIWREAFPELAAQAAQPGPGQTGECVHFVTVVSQNISAYQSSRTITIGDILAPVDASLSPVVAAEDAAITVSANTPSSKRGLRVYVLSKRGQPSPQSEYGSVINHDSQIERVIRIGIAEQYHACAIQDVIWYLKNEVPTLTIGQSLWNRLGGTGQVPTPTPAYPGTAPRSPCLGNPVVHPGSQQQAASMTLKNLAVIVGAVVPFGLVLRRKDRTPRKK